MADLEKAKTILVVEDESIIAMDIRNSLRRLGYQTPAAVHDAEEAIAATARLAPDLVLMDICLKGEMDGIEAAKIIKERFHLPIVYLTANTDEKTFDRAKRTAPSGYLLKPFEERELRTTIETALYKHQTEQKLQRYRDHLEELVQKRTADLEETHRALRQSEENYRTIFNSANDAILVIEAESGRIVDSNEKVRDLTGYSPEEIKALTVNDLGADTSLFPLGRTCPPLRQAAAGTPQVFEWVIKHRGGACNWVEVSLKDAAVGGRNCLLAVVRDIALRKEAEIMLIRAKEEAEAANRLKTQFLANMSHEIRTPMNAILGMARVTMETELTAAQRRYLQMILDAGQTLLGLLNDILDFSKLESDQILLERQPFDFCQLLEESARALAMQANAKGLDLICHPPAGLGHALIGDSLRLRQVLLNLLGNAIKFTPAGHILLRAAIVSEDDATVVMCVGVSDTGIGIDADKQAAIFDRFTQADSSTTRSFGGAGLGLAITGKLVELMGGTIRLESAKGRGSTFYVTLPFAKDIPLRREPAAQPRLDGATALVIDDNPHRRRLLAELLDDLGLRSQTADTIDAGLALIRQHEEKGAPLSLICADSSRGDANTVSLSRQLTAAVSDQNTRAILFCPPLTPESCCEIDKMAGRARCVEKPVTRASLRRAIEAIFARGEAASADKRTAGRILRLPRATPLRLLFVEANPHGLEELRAALEDRGFQLYTATTGRQALETLGKNRVDLIFLDLELQDQDGRALAGLIRRCEQLVLREDDGPRELVWKLRSRLIGGHLPIVAMAPPTSAQDRERCLAAGMDDYLVKPFELEAALAAITRLTSDDS